MTRWQRRTTLPFADPCFDAVWFANTTQYLGDAQLAVLAELQRVVRPGGVVAVKAQDGIGITRAPHDPVLIWRMFAALRPDAAPIRRVLRARQRAGGRLRGGACHRRDGIRDLLRDQRGWQRRLRNIRRHPRYGSDGAHLDREKQRGYRICGQEAGARCPWGPVSESVSIA